MKNQTEGYFQAFINENVCHITQKERTIINQITQIVQKNAIGTGVKWAGSQHKKTAIKGSDLDLCVISNTPVTLAQRRTLSVELQRRLNRPTQILSHAIRLGKHGKQPKIDLAFAHAAFGSRPLPDPAPFLNQPARQMTARALKLWSRRNASVPHLSGWVIEALVISLDAPQGQRAPFELFLRVIDWLDVKANPGAIEGILKPVAYPKWRPEWSQRLPGSLQALKNQARALKRRTPAPTDWRKTADVGCWLCQ